MGKYLNKIYNLVSNPDLLHYINGNDLDISWLIEAGCHDGTDTLRFLSDQRFRKIFAFEPDPVSFELASKNLADHRNRVILQKIALMDKPVPVKAHPLEGLFGTGSTIFIPTLGSEVKHSTENNIVVSCLDEKIPKLGGEGALWLDVEGSAVPVLQGASRILKQITIAQIEIDMHTQSKERLKNYRTVFNLMKAEGFSLVAAPLHPGYFGDALFIKLRRRSVSLRAKSSLLFFTMIILHSLIYPLLSKPERVKIPA
jgi:FkbM family methyltransferase